MKKYCVSCNFPNEVSDLVNIQFCQKCGKKFASAVASSIKTPISLELEEENEDVEVEQKPRPKPDKFSNFKNKLSARRRETEDNYEDDDSPPETNINDIDLDNLKIEIEPLDTNRNKTTLGNLALDKGEKTKIDKPRNNKKISNKEFLKTWESELKSSRQSSKEIGGNE